MSEFKKAQPLTEDDERHGSYAGVIAHQKQGIPTCDPCRAARAAYARQRRSDPAKYAEDQLRTAARFRAMSALARKHHDEFEALYCREVNRAKRGEVA